MTARPAPDSKTRKSLAELKAQDTAIPRALPSPPVIHTLLDLSAVNRHELSEVVASRSGVMMSKPSEKFLALPNQLDVFR